MSGLRPPSDSVKEALRWISSERLQRPQEKLAKLVDEAAARFDLSPREEEFLLQSLVEPR